VLSAPWRWRSWCCWGTRGALALWRSGFESGRFAKEGQGMRLEETQIGARVTESDGHDQCRVGQPRVLRSRVLLTDGTS
jgi:hypothetical protein